MDEGIIPPSAVAQPFYHDTRDWSSLSYSHNGADSFWKQEARRQLPAFRRALGADPGGPLEKELYEFRPIMLDEGLTKEQVSAGWRHRKFCQLGEMGSQPFLEWLEPASMAFKTNLYIGVNPRGVLLDGKLTGKKCGIPRCWFVYLDADGFDEKGLLNVLLPLGIVPAAIVRSSLHGCHPWIRLSSPATIEQAESLTVRLRMVFGQKISGKGMDKLKDASRILALPCTMNRPDEAKRRRGRVEEPRWLSMAWDASISPEELSSRLPKEPEKPPHAKVSPEDMAPEGERERHALAYMAKVWSDDAATARSSNCMGDRTMRDVRRLYWDFSLPMQRVREILAGRDAEMIEDEYYEDYCEEQCEGERGNKAGCDPRELMGDFVADQPLTAFPLDVLPKEYLDVVETLTAGSQTPPDFAGVLMLAIVGYMSSLRERRICWAPGMRETPNVYSFVVAEPSEHKSTVISALLVPLKRQQDISVIGYEHEVRQWEAEKAEARMTAKKNVQSAVKLAGLEAKPPFYPRMIVDDITPESLGHRLQGNRHLIFLSGECQVANNMLARYSDVQNNNLWLKLYGGEHCQIDRRGSDRPIDLDGCTISIACCVQPDAVRSMANEVKNARGTGLLSRFLFSWPESLVGYRDQFRNPGMDGSRLAAWSDEIDRLMAMPKDEVLTLSDAASDRLCQFAQRIEDGLLGRLAPIADWCGKVQKGGLAKLAGILHLAWKKNGREIDLETMNRAVRLASYFLRQAQRAFDALEMSRGQVLAQKAFKYIKKNSGCSTEAGAKAIHCNHTEFRYAAAASGCIDKCESKAGTGHTK